MNPLSRKVLTTKSDGQSRKELSARRKLLLLNAKDFLADCRFRGHIGRQRDAPSLQALFTLYDLVWRIPRMRISASPSTVGTRAELLPSLESGAHLMLRP